MKTMEPKSIRHISRRFRRFARANKAVSALEYAILVGVIAVAAVTLMDTFSGNIADAIEKISTNIETKTKDTGNK